jgi:hypothetical protein
MKVQLELTPEQADEIALQSLKDAQKNLYVASTKTLMFADDKALDDALTIVINHYSVG